MSSAIMTSSPQISRTLEGVLIQGDLSKLTSEQRVEYYKGVCTSVGLNPLTRPFDYIVLNGKLTLYAKRDATDQLRKIHKVSIIITTRERIDDVYVVTARAKTLDGREDESTGAVHLGGARGEQLANLFMKAETKAKRRVTLSICGMSLLDETEVESISPPAAIAEPSAPTEIKQVDLDSPLAFYSEFEITFGKYKGKKFKDVPVEDLENYVRWIEHKANSEGKPIQGAVLELFEAVRAYASSSELGELK